MPRVHNYALKIPWAHAEAQQWLSQQCGVTATYLRNLSFDLLGHFFSAASPDELDCRTYIGEKTKEATGFTHKGNTKVESVHDRYTYFIYLHATYHWIGHVK